MNIAFYNKATGKISVRYTGSPEVLTDLLPEGEEMYLNCPEEATHIIDDRPVAIGTEQPIPHQVFATKARRAGLLAACDWTQLPDSPLSPERKLEWAKYRQALRDVPNTQQDMANPVWPKAPQR